MARHIDGYQLLIAELLTSGQVTRAAYDIAKNVTDRPYLQKVLWTVSAKDQFRWMINSRDQAQIELGFGEMKAFILSSRLDPIYKKLSIDFLEDIAEEAARRALSRLEQKPQKTRSKSEQNQIDLDEARKRLTDALANSPGVVHDSKHKSQKPTNKPISAKTKADHERYRKARKLTSSKQILAPGMSTGEIRKSLQRHKRFPRHRRVGLSSSLTSLIALIGLAFLLSVSTRFNNSFGIKPMNSYPQNVR